MIATVEAKESNRGKLGVNRSKIVYLIDEGFKIDKDNIEIIYKDGETGEETKINDYMIQNNNLWVEYGKGQNNENEEDNYVTKAGDKLIIKVKGEFAKIKEYSNSITLLGYLTDYKGTNTNIYLGEITRTDKKI